MNSSGKVILIYVAPAEEGGRPVFLLRVFVNPNVEMGNSFKEKTEPLFVLRQSVLKMGGYSFSAFKKNQHEIFMVGEEINSRKIPPYTYGQLHLR